VCGAQCVGVAGCVCLCGRRVKADNDDV